MNRAEGIKLGCTNQYPCLDVSIWKLSLFNVITRNCLRFTLSEIAYVLVISVLDTPRFIGIGEGHIH